eukprot:11683340-Alexandrium_andersonii.AAC.1
MVDGNALAASFDALPEFNDDASESGSHGEDWTWGCVFCGLELVTPHFLVLVPGRSPGGRPVRN